VKILFSIDLKHRDVASASLIGFYLRGLGHEIKFCPVWSEEEVLKTFKADAIVIPKPILEKSLLARWKLRNIAIISFNTEGNPQDIEYQYKIPVSPDLIITWNKKQEESHKEYLEKNPQSCFGEVQIVNLGCMRLDFHHKDFSFLFASKKDDMRGKFGFTTEDTIITVATSTQDADIPQESRLIMSKRREKDMAKSASYWDIVENHDISRETTINSLKKIVNLEGVKILLKPHPNESTEFWKKTISEFPKGRIFIQEGGSIQDLLSVSSLHITNNVCTTTFEAKLNNIMTVEIQTSLSKKLFEEVHLNVADYQVFSPDQAFKVVKEALLNRNSNKGLDQDFKEYTENYYGRFDGKRCQEYAEKIDAFVSELELLKFDLIQNTRLFFISWYPRIKDILITQPLYQGSILKNKIIDSFSSYSNSNKDIVSEGRQRFDPTIEEGDELYWLDQFEGNISFREQ